MPFNRLFINQNESLDYHFTESDFNLFHWQAKKDSVELTGGRGASQKIIIHGQSYVLRLYLRGGFIARFLYDRYLWTGLTRSRPFLENKVVQHALKNNLPVPEVVAFCVKKQGLFYQASIISRFIPNKGTLADILSDSEMPHKQWFELGAVIKHLHQARIFHADLNANNILVDEQGGFTIIDFDKAQIMSSIKGKADNNIQRLLRSLKKIQAFREQEKSPFHFKEKHWQQLLAGYR